MAKDFTKNVLNIVSRIPRGKIMTYTQVAKLSGSPKAYRAVGNILKQNYREHESQLPVIKGQDIPCHRVIRANGIVGGYAKGEKEKEKLLALEGHVIDRHKIKLMNLA